jgi:hypothetical protein
MSQTKALRALSDSMERLVKPGETGPGGFFDHFFEGMKRGMQSSPEFMELMKNIRLSLREATLQGVKLGRMFVDLFPGVKDVFGGLSEIFKPERFREFFGGIIKAFDVFKEGGTGKMEDFMEKLKKNFFNFFDKSTPAGSRVVEGFKKFSAAILTVLGKLSEWVVIKFSNIVNAISDWIENPKGFNKPKFDNFGRMIQNPFEKTLDALANNLRPALERFVNLVIEKIKEAFLNAPWYLQLGAAFKFFGPALGNILGAVITNKLKEKALEKAVSEGTEVALERGLKAAIKSKAAEEGGKAIALGVGKKVASGIAAEAPVVAAEGAVMGATAGTAAGTGFFAGFGTVFAGGIAAVLASPLILGALIVGSLGAVATAFTAVADFAENWKEKQEREANQKDMYALMEDKSKSVEQKIKTLSEDRQKLLDKAAEKEGMGFLNWIRGTKSEGQANLEALARQREDQIQQLTEGEAKRLAEEQKVKKQIEDNIAALGPVTIDNAADRFKKIDELAKQVMGSDFDVQSKLDAVRKKLSDINWTVLTPGKEEEANKALLALTTVKDVVASIADIGGITKLAADKLAEMGDSFSTESPAYKSLSSDGNIVGAVKKAGETFGSLDLASIKTATTNVKDAVTSFSALTELSDAAIKYSTSAGNVSEEVILASMTKTINTVKKMVSTMQQMENLLSDAGKDIKISTRLGAIAGKFGLGSSESFTVQKKDVVLNISLSVTMDAGKVEKAIILNKDSIIRDRINFALGAGTGKDSTVPQSIMSSGQGALTPAAPSVQ